MKLTIRFKGGEGSGHHGHAGRPGKVGGSLPGKYYPGEAPQPDNPGAPIQTHAWSDRKTIDFVEADLRQEYEDLVRLEIQQGNITVDFETFMEGKEDFGFADVDGNLRGDIKHHIVQDIADAATLEYDTVNDLIANWAKTSNGRDLRALLLQQDMADELGLELSDWQKNSIIKLLEDKEEFLERAIVKANENLKYAEITSVQSYIDEKYEWDVEDFQKDLAFYQADPGLHTFKPEKPVYMTVRQAELELASRYGASSDYKKFFRLHPEEDQKAFGRAMYDITQYELGEQGIDTVKLFRGFDTGFDEPKMEWVPPRDSVVGYFGNALESWTADYDVAKSFGNTVLTMEVPVENVIGTCRTGFGCLTEAEIVIYANERGQDPARPFSIGQTAHVIRAPNVLDEEPLEDRSDVYYDQNWNPIIQ